MAVAVVVGDATAGCRVRAPRLPPQAASLGHTWLLLPGRWGCCRGQWGTRGPGAEERSEKPRARARCEGRWWSARGARPQRRRTGTVGRALPSQPGRPGRPGGLTRLLCPEAAAPAEERPPRPPRRLLPAAAQPHLAGPAAQQGRSASSRDRRPPVSRVPVLQTEGSPRPACPCPRPRTLGSSRWNRDFRREASGGILELAGARWPGHAGPQGGRRPQCLCWAGRVGRAAAGPGRDAGRARAGTREAGQGAARVSVW